MCTTSLTAEDFDLLRGAEDELNWAFSVLFDFSMNSNYEHMNRSIASF